MEEILATLPAKPAADKMMKRFFDDENSPVPTFRKPGFSMVFDDGDLLTRIRFSSQTYVHERV